MDKNLIAPCGINCGVCRAHLREKNRCPGCKNSPTLKSCQNCKIKLCNKRKGEYCLPRAESRGGCADFPCERLKHLDKRYREKYGMSEIENLEFIKKHGIEKFLRNQIKKYICNKGILCVHDRKFYKG